MGNFSVDAPPWPPTKGPGRSPSRWNTSQVTDMHSMFTDAPSFNGDLSRCTDMHSMFTDVQLQRRSQPLTPLRSQNALDVHRRVQLQRRSQSPAALVSVSIRRITLPPSQH